MYSTCICMYMYIKYRIACPSLFYSCISEDYRYVYLYTMCASKKVKGSDQLIVNRGIDRFIYIVSLSAHPNHFRGTQCVYQPNQLSNIYLHFAHFIKPYRDPTHLSIVFRLVFMKLAVCTYTQILSIYPSIHLSI